MPRISATYRIAIALVGIAVCVLVLANTLGFIPDRNELELRSRVHLCEAVAINCSLAAARDDPAHIEASLLLVAERYDDVLFAVLNKADGETLVEAGSQPPSQAENGTGSSTGGEPPPLVVSVPLLVGGEPWGTIDVGFRSLSSWEISRLLGGSNLLLIAFVAALSCLFYIVYLRRVLTHLNPTKVIPPRVRSTLNTLAEGLLVLNKDEQIVLANEAFAKTVGRKADELQGHSAKELPWIACQEGQSPEFPWADAVRTANLKRALF